MGDAQMRRAPAGAPTDEVRWNAVVARDPRYDGSFVTGVLTTGIYCRPSCAARQPRRENVRFFEHPELFATVWGDFDGNPVPDAG